MREIQVQQLNVVSFDDPMKAQEFLLAAKRLASESKLQLDDVVFVAKTSDGKRVRVHETTDTSVGEAAMSGGFWGLLFGMLLLGPYGVIAGAATAGTSALVSKLVDTGVSDAFIKEMKDAVAPGDTAVILLTGGGNLDAVTEELRRFSGARLLRSDLPAEAREAVEAALANGVSVEQVEVVSSPVPS